MIKEDTFPQELTRNDQFRKILDRKHIFCSEMIRSDIFWKNLKTFEQIWQEMVRNENLWSEMQRNANFWQQMQRNGNLAFSCKSFLFWALKGLARCVRVMTRTIFYSLLDFVSTQKGDRKMPSKEIQSKVRTKKIEVRVDEVEKASIECAAEACNLTVSDYLRKIGTGFVPASRVDQLAIIELSRLHSDLGRLGGLFKLALTGAGGVQSKQTSQTLGAVSADIKDAMLTLRQAVIALENN